MLRIYGMFGRFGNGHYPVRPARDCGRGQDIMPKHIEWPTVVFLVVTYAVWLVALFLLPGLSLVLAVVVAGVAIAQHSSLQHEATHGHPFERQAWNSAVAGAGLSLVIPYLRFRATHLAHHQDCELTDPFDDPESNFLDDGVWRRLPRVVRWVLDVNNTLAGRMILGPLVGTLRFFWAEIRTAPSDPEVIRGWAWHVVATVPVVLIVIWSPMPVWAYGVAVYLALSLLRIRTFLEHQAHEVSRARSVIIEDRGPLALLFLNNNLHIVHHMHPRLPWYRLPTVYREGRDRFLRVNGGYRFGSYAEVFRRYLFRRKDPVAHPLWRRHGAG